MKNFVVYKSSAGSGKTTTLAIEYLKLCLPQPENFRHILALTFTKDAANEMKQRILEYLIRIIQFKGGHELDFIFKPLFEEQQNALLNEEGIKKIQQQAHVLLKRILHNYSDFAISTIDSFTHRVIKSFAHDLGIAISFDVELEKDNLIKTAVNELISRIGEQQPQLTSVLLDFSLEKIGSDKSRKVEDDLRQLASNLLEDVKEDFLVDLRKLSIEELLQMKDQVFAQINHFQKEVLAEAVKAKEIIRSEGLSCKDFYYGSGNICNWFFRLAEPNFNDGALEAKPRVLKSVEEDVWYSAKTNEAVKVRIDSIKSTLLAHFNKLQDYFAENANDYLIYKQISKHIYPLVVLNEIEQLLVQLKAESNVLHISDFNKIIARAIQGEPAPFIYERIGNWYWHFLLDEFQDTSALQWHNLLPLIENSLSENHFSLLVGDGKQSIYRWRGGDVEQFAQLPALLNATDDLSRQREQLLKQNYEEKKLVQNFRSDEQIVEFNNDIFRFIQTENWLPATYKKVYAEVEQQFVSSKKGLGMVDVQLVENDPEVLNAAVLEMIQTALSEGYDYRHMTILVRKNNEAADYAELLIQHDIPVISKVGLRVSSSDKVQFLLSCFRLILSPEEPVYGVEMLRYLLQKDVFPQYNMSHFHSLVARLMQDPNGFSHALTATLKQAGFSFEFERVNQSDVYELCESLIRTFKLFEPDAYVQFFLDNLHEFKYQTYNQLSDFMVWWEEHKNDLFIELPEGLNAVTIQTVFKAKGLQYPVVIYPVTDKSLTTNKSRNRAWLNPGVPGLQKLKSFPFSLNQLKNTALEDVYIQEQSKQKLDDINLFYVALTRAKHRLFILSNWFEQTKKKQNSPQESNFVPSQLLDAYVNTKPENKQTETGYRFGTRCFVPEEQPLDQSGFYYLHDLQNTNWRKTLHLTNALQYRHTDQVPTRQIWGIYVHAILAAVQHLADIERAINRALYAGYLNANDGKKVRHILEQVVAHPVLKPFYSADVRVANETDLLDNFGFYHRPDRLVFLENKTVIIDYKTGNPKKEYQKQVREYAELLAQVGFPNPEAYLVYLSDNVEVVKV